ncbi:TPA: amino acid adenylation domain-containing protein [Bacillus cereus]
MDLQKVYELVSNKKITPEEAIFMLEQENWDKNSINVAKDVEFPLSEGQKALWITHQLNRENYAYNVPAAFWLSPTTDLLKLKNILQKMTKYHSALRTKLKVINGQPHQYFSEDFEIDFIEESIDNLNNEELDRVLQKEIKKPFDLKKDNLFRIHLYKQKNGKNLLLFVFHHIIFDGISSQIFIEDLERFYQKEDKTSLVSSSLNSLDFQDFVLMQKVMLASEEGEEHKKYWLGQLQDVDGVLDLPLDKPRPIYPTFKGSSFEHEIKGALVHQLRSLAQRNNTTLFSVMLSAFKGLLYRYCNVPNISVGIPMAGRMNYNFEKIIGNFMNVVVIKSGLAPDLPFNILLQNVQDTVFEAMEHSDYPLFTLTQDLRALNSNSQLFNVSFYFQNWLDTPENVEESSLIIDTYKGLHQEGESDLTLEIVEEDEKYLLCFKYNPDLFEEETLIQMKDNYLNVLSCVTEDEEVKLADIELLRKKEIETLSMEENIFDLFVKQVEKSPNALAVVFNNELITYQELYQKSSKIAVYLQSKGIKQGDLVGIFMNRSADLLAIILGVLRSGAGFVPLDPIYPTNRLSMMIEDSKLDYVITESMLLDKLPLGNFDIIQYDIEYEKIKLMENELIVHRDANSVAYVIFTSGSTGRPKGVEVLHKGLTNFLYSMAEKPGFTSNDRILAITTICFDIAYLEIFLPIVTGGVVEIVASDIINDGIKLKEKIENTSFSVMQATPATWKMLLQAGWRKELPIKILCGGEELSNELADNLLNLSREVWNLYGPTETTIWSAVAKIEDKQDITIGNPIMNTQLYVLDNNLNSCPIGAVGELYIGGEGLAKGYINNTEETSKKFLSNPFSLNESQKIYKTGDMARYREDGKIECLGRIDNQVKIRGFRIELNEIEKALQEVDGVIDAVVLLRNEDIQNKRLTAFVIAENSIEEISVSFFHKLLSDKLPKYMIPAQFIRLSNFPSTLNGKFDRKTLSSKKISEIQQLYYNKELINKSEHTSSLNQEYQKNNHYQEIIVQDLTKIIVSILGIDGSIISTDKHFGEYGFDSISFTSFGVAINDLYNIQVNATLFYEYSTLDSLAEYLFQNYESYVRIYYQKLVQESKELARNDKQVIQNDILSTQNKEQSNIESDEKVAIIGISGQMPGSANLKQYWNNLVRLKDLISLIPKDRWDYKLYTSDLKGRKSTSYSKWGGFMSDVYHFDSLFFGISPREAEIMDPQQRLFLQTTWEVIEDAGYKPSDLSGTDTGIFVGCTGTDFLDVLHESNHDIEAHSISGISRTIIPNRISYLLNLHGPSAVIDTACSSSLVSIHRAVNSILSGECSMAIAGGTNVILSPVAQDALSKSNMLSSDGRCKVFDKSANGYVRGEGVAAILLKPLSKAIEDGDNIYGVIASTSENHGGKTNSLTTPNVNAQTELLVEAYRKAKINPSTVTYLESHGTGTALGDPIEINALKKAFNSLYKQADETFKGKPYCGIGSVKSNIGHLEASAGIAGVLKVILAMKHGVIPGNLHLNEVNPLIELNDTPFYLLKNTQEWKHLVDEKGEEIPFRAGISSFGFGGVNAHIVLEEFKKQRGTYNYLLDSYIIILSAKNEDGLYRYAKQLLQYLEDDYNEKEVSLGDVAYTLQIGRESYEERLALIVNNSSELHEKLVAFCSGDKKIPNLFRGSKEDNKNKLSLVLEGEEGNEYIRNLVTNRKDSKLTLLWINGMDIDWKLLYEGSPSRVALPTYPFAKTEYKISLDFNNEIRNGKNCSLPLIDNMHPTSEHEILLCFRKELCRNEVILQHHEVDGQAILPAVGYLEMICEAVSLFRKGTYRFSKVTWLAPLTVQNETKEVFVIFKAQKQNMIQYEVRSSKIDGMIHAQGSIQFLDNEESPSKTSISIDEIKDKFENVLDKEIFYTHVREAGINYREYFQVMETVWSNDTSALGFLKLPINYVKEFSRYKLHPAIMDGALQVMAMLSKGNNKPKVPFSVERIEVIQSPTEECYAYVQKNTEESFNIILLDKDGNICVKFKTLLSREIKGKHKNMYYYPTWVKVPLTNVNISSNDSSVLIITSERPTGIETKLKEHFKEAIEVRLGKKNREIKENIYEIDSENPFAIHQMIDKLVNIQQVYYLGAIHRTGYELQDLSLIGKMEEDSIVNFFRLCKALDEQDLFRKNIKLTVVTNDSVNIVGSENTTPFGSGIYGFAMSAAVEFPYWNIQCVDVSFEINSQESICKKLIELSHYPQNKENEFLALREQNFYKRVIKDLELKPSTFSSFKNSGVYFIVGGTGGIGLSLGKYLAKNFKAKLVLTGRSELTGELEEKIKEIESFGSEVLYLQADVTSIEDMEYAVEEATIRFGKVDGVIHSALVLKDQSIRSMSEDILREVMASKIRGSVILYKVFEKKKLDFMLFFSSTCSFLKSAGQSNYSAGCMFQDMFSAVLHDVAPFPVKTINWSYWSEAGVVANKKYVEKLTSQGILGIKIEEGIQAIEEVLSSGVKQTIVQKTSKDILDNMNYDTSYNVRSYPPKIPGLANQYDNYSPDTKEQGLILDIVQGIQRIEEYGVLLLWKTLQEMGCFKTKQMTYNKAELRKQINIINNYENLFEAILIILEKYGYISIKGENILVVSTPNIKHINEDREQICLSYPSLLPYIDLLEACLFSYPEVLTGKKDHMSVMFPNGSKMLVEPIYKGNELVDFYNKTVASIIENYVTKRLEQDKNSTINVLEIGAGTGGTSAFVFEKLKKFKNNVNYCYTDISVGFTRYGKAEYGNKFGFGTFKVLDIEKDIKNQGFLENNIDLCFATNAIHATSDISNALENVKILLKSNGIFILNELTKLQIFSTLTFGLTNGWWLFKDPSSRIKASPLLSPRQWKTQLSQQEFKNIKLIDVFNSEEIEKAQSIIIAESNGIVKLKKDMVHKHQLDVEDTKHVNRVTDKVIKKERKSRDKVYNALSDFELYNKMYEYLEATFANILKIEVSILKNDVPFEKYGVDSLIIIELNKIFEEEFNDVPTTVLFECVTLKDLTQYFITNHLEEIKNKFRVEAEVIEEIAATSEDDVVISNEDEFINVENNNPDIKIENSDMEIKLPYQSNDEIAIVGVAGRYPLADSVEEYWDNLVEGRNCITEIPKERWDLKGFYDATSNEHGKSYSKWGGFIKDIDKFDADFFGISEGLASEMDPQERIFLELTWHLLEDAGYPYHSLSSKGYRTGVFCGVMYGTYGTMGTVLSEQGIYTGAQSSYWLIPNRVSHYFNFNGPSFSIDSACSSSLTAIHLACESIKRGECDTAVVGGINLILSPRHFLRLSNLKNLSSSDETKTFGSGADGFVVGEGAGAILLKPLSKAIQDNDKIYGVVKGSFINSTGNSGGFMAPNPVSQANLIEEALKKSGVDPRTISYIEAHGTGTILGDPVEISGLTKTFRKFTLEKQFCAIGSVKSNIGHLEAAAGISALTKILMQMKYKKLVPSLHAGEVNPYIKFEDTPFYLQKTLSDWNAPIIEGKLYPRRAGVSSFGAGGANAHLIVEEYLENEGE